MTLFVLMSHRLSVDQEREARQVWGVEDVCYLPGELQVLWSSVDPYGALDPGRFVPVLAWLKERSRPQDLALIQGEYGLTVYFVMVCWSLGLLPLYAATERVYQEEPGPDGTIVRRHAFRHVNFREYVRYGE